MMGMFMNKIVAALALTLCILLSGCSVGSRQTAHLDSPDEPEMVQCEYCGGWFEAGNIFRNHICPERDAALAPQQ